MSELVDAQPSQQQLRTQQVEGIPMCCCCCCLATNRRVLTELPSWAIVLLAYLGWFGFGFLFGFHWLVILFCVARRKTDRVWALVYFLCFIVAVGLVAGGGAYVRGANQSCDNGTEMSHHCLFTKQTGLYKRVYILHFVGLAWIVTAWIMDGLQMWHWTFFSYAYKERNNITGMASSFQDSKCADSAGNKAGNNADLKLTKIPNDGGIHLLYSKQYISQPIYLCVLAATVILVTLTWTLFITNWSTDPSAEQADHNIMSIEQLAGWLLLEILLCTALTCIILNLMRLCKSQHPSDAD